MDLPSSDGDLIQQCISLNDLLSKERSAEKRRGITGGVGEWAAVNDTHVKVDRGLKNVIDVLHMEERRAEVCEKWTHENIFSAFLSPILQGEPSSVLCNRYARAVSLCTVHNNALWSFFFHKVLEELKKTGQKDTTKRIGMLYVVEAYFEAFTEFRPKDTKIIADLISHSDLLSMFQKMVRAGGAFTVDVPVRCAAFRALQSMARWCGSDSRGGKASRQQEWITTHPKLFSTFRSLLKIALRAIDDERRDIAHWAVRVVREFVATSDFWADSQHSENLLTILHKNVDSPCVASLFPRLAECLGILLWRLVHLRVPLRKSFIPFRKQKDKYWTFQRVLAGGASSYGSSSGKGESEKRPESGTHDVIGRSEERRIGSGVGSSASDLRAESDISTTTALSLSTSASVPWNAAVLSAFFRCMPNESVLQPTIMREILQLSSSRLPRKVSFSIMESVIFGRPPAVVWEWCKYILKNLMHGVGSRKSQETPRVVRLFWMKLLTSLIPLLTLPHLATLEKELFECITHGENVFSSHFDTRVWNARIGYALCAASKESCKRLIEKMITMVQMAFADSQSEGMSTSEQKMKLCTLHGGSLLLSSACMCLKLHKLNPGEWRFEKSGTESLTLISFQSLFELTWDTSVLIYSKIPSSSVASVQSMWMAQSSLLLLASVLHMVPREVRSARQEVVETIWTMFLKNHIFAALSKGVQQATFPLLLALETLAFLAREMVSEGWAMSEGMKKLVIDVFQGTMKIQSGIDPTQKDAHYKVEACNMIRCYLNETISECFAISSAPRSVMKKMISSAMYDIVNCGDSLNSVIKAELDPPHPRAGKQYGLFELQHHESPMTFSTPQALHFVDVKKTPWVARLDAAIVFFAAAYANENNSSRYKISTTMSSMCGEKSISLWYNVVSAHVLAFRRMEKQQEIINNETLLEFLFAQGTERMDSNVAYVRSLAELYLYHFGVVAGAQFRNDYLKRGFEKLVELKKDLAHKSLSSSSSISSSVHTAQDSYISCLGPIMRGEEGSQITSLSMLSEFARMHDPTIFSPALQSIGHVVTIDTGVAVLRLLLSLLHSPSHFTEPFDALWIVLESTRNLVACLPPMGDGDDIVLLIEALHAFGFQKDAPRVLEAASVVAPMSSSFRKSSLFQREVSAAMRAILGIYEREPDTSLVSLNRYDDADVQQLISKGVFSLRLLIEEDISRGVLSLGIDICKHSNGIWDKNVFVDILTLLFFIREQLQRDVDDIEVIGKRVVHSFVESYGIKEVVETIRGMTMGQFAVVPMFRNGNTTDIPSTMSTPSSTVGRPSVQPEKKGRSSASSGGTLGARLRRGGGKAASLKEMDENEEEGEDYEEENEDEGDWEEEDLEYAETLEDDGDDILDARRSGDITRRSASKEVDASSLAAEHVVRESENGNGGGVLLQSFKSSSASLSYGCFVMCQVAHIAGESGSNEQLRTLPSGVDDLIRSLYMILCQSEGGIQEQSVVDGVCHAFSILITSFLKCRSSLDPSRSIFVDYQLQITKIVQLGRKCVWNNAGFVRLILCLIKNHGEIFSENRQIVEDSLPALQQFGHDLDVPIRDDVALSLAIAMVSGFSVTITDERVIQRWFELADSRDKNSEDIWFLLCAMEMSDGFSKSGVSLKLYILSRFLELLSGPIRTKWSSIMNEEGLENATIGSIQRLAYGLVSTNMDRIVDLTQIVTSIALESGADTLLPLVTHLTGIILSDGSLESSSALLSMFSMFDEQIIETSVAADEKNWERQFVSWIRVGSSLCKQQSNALKDNVKSVVWMSVRLWFHVCHFVLRTSTVTPSMPVSFEWSSLLLDMMEVLQNCIVKGGEGMHMILMSVLDQIGQIAVHESMNSDSSVSSPHAIGWIVAMMFRIEQSVFDVFSSTSLEGEARLFQTIRYFLGSTFENVVDRCLKSGPQICQIFLDSFLGSLLENGDSRSLMFPGTLLLGPCLEMGHLRAMDFFIENVLENMSGDEGLPSDMNLCDLFVSLLQSCVKGLRDVMKKGAETSDGVLAVKVLKRMGALSPPDYHRAMTLLGEREQQELRENLAQVVKTIQRVSGGHRAPAGQTIHSETQEKLSLRIDATRFK